jgi:hypothetical protein
MWPMLVIILLMMLMSNGDALQLQIKVLKKAKSTKLVSKPAKECPGEVLFDPFKFSAPQSSVNAHKVDIRALSISPLVVPDISHAALFGGDKSDQVSTISHALSESQLKDLYDPSLFQPVCPASDGVYQGIKLIANRVVGSENVAEYGPLIASVLLRVRLELCVLESFLYEAVIPFIKQRGLSWVLPLHETLETFIAGSIFAVAMNVILLGSTKIISVMVVFIDALTALPLRFLGKQLKSKLSNKSPGYKMGIVMKAYGDIIGAIRQFLEVVDTFVGRYLVVATTIYVAFKFTNYKLFP